MAISKGTIGAINELRIAQNLMSLGWGVFRCLSPNNPTDLVAVKGRTVLKVQCKSSMNGQFQNIRAGNNDLLVLIGLDGELRYRARSKRVARMFPGKGNVSNLSGAFVDLDAAVSSIKSADSGTRSK